MTVHMGPQVQYRDLSGRVELDQADLEHFEKILGIEGWLPLGISLYCGHGAIGEPAARSTPTPALLSGPLSGAG